MKTKKKAVSISVVIPLYNSEKTLGNELISVENTIKAFTREYEIIVVDDKSSDKSRKILKRFKDRQGFKIFFNKHNIGIYSNLRKVYSIAKKEYILLYSVDGDWNTKDIHTLAKTALRTGADIVIGERTLKIGYSLYRRLITYFHNMFPRILFGVDTVDAASIKMFKRSVYRQFTYISQSVFIEAEFLIRASREGYTIRSVPVHYAKKDSSKKNYVSLPLIIESLRDACKLRLLI